MLKRALFCHGKDIARKFHSIFVLYTTDLKGLRVNSPCDNSFQTAIDIHEYDSFLKIIYGAPIPILSKIRLMDKIKYISVPGIPLFFNSY